MKERELSNNGWAAKKNLDKRMKKEAGASWYAQRDLKLSTERYKTKREKNERAATAAKRERKALYGQYNPNNAISLCCHMMVINGACSGCGE